MENKSPNKSVNPPTTPSQPITDYSGETIHQPRPANTTAINNQGQTSQANTATDQSTNPVENISKKIKFWKNLSITLGLITFFSYIVVLITANVLAHKSQYGWAVFMMSGLFWRSLIFIFLILSIISLIRVIILNSQRHQHSSKDYITAIIGLALIFSPYAISGILSFFRISCNNDNGVSVTVKSKDPYYINGDSSASWVCAAGHKTSNDLKNVDINDYYSYVEDVSERKLFAAESYVEQIGEEILCQVGSFYKENGRYPNENEIKSFSSEAVSDDVRAGVYDIKLEIGEEPNERDFTILFDKDCSNKTTEPRNIVVLSPLYGEKGRYCVHNDINTIINNIDKTKK